MGTHSNWALRQRWAATGLVSCLLVSGVLGTVLDCQAIMRPATAPGRTEYLDRVREPDAAGNQVSAVEGATVSAGGAYMQVTARTDYRATTGRNGQFMTYTVKPGDSLWLIAQTYNTDISTLLSLNPEITSTVIQPGEILEVVPAFLGLGHIVRHDETLSEIAEGYSLSATEIQTANGLALSDHLAVGQWLLLPGARVRQSRGIVASRSVNPRRASQAAADGQARSLGWIWPIAGGLHSSEFGQRWGGFHSGLDIAVSTGTPAASVASGTVTFAGWDGGYGYSVILDHGGGIRTRYAHASKLLVAEGQTVEQGEDVILVGATGNSTGPHLHFEVLVDGTPQNPRVYLP